MIEIPDHLEHEGAHILAAVVPRLAGRGQIPVSPEPDEAFRVDGDVMCDVSPSLDFRVIAPLGDYRLVASEIPSIRRPCMVHEHCIDPTRDDHWKPYFTYKCTHSLCNAHHLRELQRAWEQDAQHRAKTMKTLLETINRKVIDAGGALDVRASQKYRREYQDLIAPSKIECPEPFKPKEKGKRGRIKKSKSRNLLERLDDFQNEVLRFMDVEFVPFTNNLGGNDIRITKVQQKISGCFRSTEGARIFCRIRRYLSTCRKQGVSSSQALALLFNGKLPDFVSGE